MMLAVEILFAWDFIVINAEIESEHNWNRLLPFETGVWWRKLVIATFDAWYVGFIYSWNC